VKHTIVDKARMLRGTALLSEVSSEVLADLAALSAVENHPAGTTLFEEGEPADAFFVVIAGEISAWRDGAETYRVGAGDEFGTLAVLDERPRVFAARTETRSEMLRVGAADFIYLLEQHPRLARGVIRHLALEVRSTISGRGPYASRNSE